VGGQVILYADKITDSMQRAMEETARRRAVQEAYNAEHGITPQTIIKAIGAMLPHEIESDYMTVSKDAASEIPPEEIPAMIKKLKKEMNAVADDLRFEEAALIRDRIRELEAEELKWR
jgi:excinuclease ABC subunit B